MKGFFVTEKMKELFFNGLVENVETSALKTVDSIVSQALEQDKTIKEIQFYFGDTDLDEFKNDACYKKTMMSTFHEEGETKVVSHSTTCNILIGLLTTGIHQETTTVKRTLSGGSDTENYHKFVTCEMATELVTVVKNNTVSSVVRNNKTVEDDKGTVLRIYVPNAYVLGEEE